MSWTHINGGNGGNTSSSPFNISLGSVPTTGQLVVVGIANFTGSGTITSVKDTNGNTYSETTNSPLFETGVGTVWIYYWVVNATATATVTVTFTDTGNTYQGWGDIFSTSVGTATFDKDAVSPEPTSAGTTVNTPSITPSASGELLYACAVVTGSVSAPAAGGTLGSWTGSGGAIINGNMAEYDLSASSGTAVDFTCSSSNWACIAAAFGTGVTSYAFIKLEGGVGDIELEVAPGDIALETSS